MERNRLHLSRRPLAAGVLALVLWAFPSAAQRVKDASSELDALRFSKPGLHVGVRHLDLSQARSSAPEALPGAFDRFRAVEGGDWTAVFDRTSGQIARIEGSGIPWIPGTANALRSEEIGLSGGLRGEDVPVDVVAARAFDFMARNPGLFAAKPEDLVLSALGSGPVDDYLYFVTFGWTYHGIPVDRARVTFHLNHGNLVQFGQDFVDDSILRLDPTPSISPETAWDILWGYVGGRTPDEIISRPAGLLVIPVSEKARFAGGDVQAGEGLAYSLVYVLRFHREGVVGNWEARVDAHTGEILSFRDSNLYGQVRGGAYIKDNRPAEVSVPFLQADIGGGQYADLAGAFAGSSATSTLSGKWAKIVDTCGSISLSTTGGDLNFGSGSGTDCTTPGTGGAGNTHASRTQFFNLNAVKLKASAFLPSNTWITGQLTDNVNIAQACNAYYTDENGESINFFRSGSVQGYVCANTGEFPGVVFHEWAHGLDSNDGNGVPDMGSAEAYGDITAITMTRDSCPGKGMFAENCSGYGDACTDCTGVRDADSTKHYYNMPYTANWFLTWNTSCIDLLGTYSGPCGMEGHCESNIPDQAFWDLATYYLPEAGLNAATAWQTADLLWWRTRAIQGSMYSCAGDWISGFESDGCGTGSLYSVLRLADDCDGNLANGTPHAAAIYAATSLHEIACATGNNQNQSGCCPTLTAPTLSVTTAAALSWTPVSGAAKYVVFRNEVACNSGYTPLTTVTGTSATDTLAAAGIKYYYRVQPFGTTLACVGDVSNCVEVTISSTCSLSCAATVPATGTAGVAVSFVGSGTPSGCTGTPTFSWAFGDGGTSTLQSPSHVFAGAGTYSWSLTVSLSGASPCTQTGSITITVPCSLSCTAGANPSSGTAPLAVAFAATASTSGGCAGSPSFSWNFGDGGTSALQDPSHTYTAAGSYGWTLTAAVGQTTCTQTGTVVVTAGNPSTLAIGTQSGAAGSNLCVNVTLTNGGTPAITAFTTDITYDSTKLTPTGVTTPVANKLAQGNIVTAGTYRITVYGGTAVFPTGIAANVCFNTTAGQCATYTLAHASGTPTASDAAANPVAITGTAGSITTTGCTACTLTCTAGATPSSGTAPLAVTFTATATATGCASGPAYAWNFGDGGTSALQNPTHSYASAGTYTWTLAVTADQQTCTQTGTVTVSGGAANTLAIGTQSGAAGSNLCVNVTLTNGGTPSITAFTTDITYDSTKLTPTGVTTPVANKLAQGNIVAAGTYRITVYGGTTVFPTGVAANVCFNTTAGQCATYTLAHASGTPTASDAAANPVAITGTAGSITTTGCTACTLTCTAGANPTSGTAPLAVTFTATATATGCTSGPAYAWNFGDGGTSALQNPSHSYAGAGTFTWTLTVTADQQTCTQTGTITVSGGAANTLAIGTQSGAAGSNLCVNVTLTNGGTPSITAFTTDITYDPTKLTPTSVTTPVANKLAQGNIVAAGTYRITVYGGTAVFPTGVAANVCFNTTAGQCATHTLAHASGTPTASDAAANPVAITGTAGSITTTGCGAANTLAIGTQSGAAGSNLCVNITLTNGGTPAITAFTTDITYDSTKLTPTGVTTPVANKLAQGNIVTAGTYRITVYGGTTVFPTGVAASVCFNTTSGQCATYTLAHASGTPTASDAAANPVAITGTAGSITTTGCGGTLPGDCDGNGTVSIGEVQKAINMYLGILAPGCGVDCNGGGTVSIGEVQKVINAYLGLQVSC